MTINPGGAKAVIHVHQAEMKKGNPAIIVRRRGKSTHHRRVEILGPAVLHQPGTPDRCGARVWIETHADVACDEPITSTDHNEINTQV